ncbi:MAG: M56 family metallopeptidase [Limisphaerales bacterium]
MILFAHWLEAAGAWAWHTSLQACVLIVLVWLVQWAFGKMLAPRWRYALGLLVLLRLVMPAVPASSLSALNVEKLFRPTPSAPPQMQTAIPQMAFVAVPAADTVPRTLTEPKPQFEWGTLFQTGAKVMWLLGIVGMLGIAGWRHRRFLRSVTQDAVVADPRVLDLLDEAKAMIGLTRPIPVVTTAAVTTPAVFGFRKPRLLLPGDLSGRLSDGELRLIFLHELTHVQRGDVLLNWIAIFVRAMHWFNPLVWLALRQLRADQELVCDASVLARLAPDERRLYGHTLVKLASDFSETRLCPGLAPVITHKHEIKRRVLMIAQFKPTGRIALAASALLLAVLCGFTFTRAAEPTEQKKPLGSGSTASPERPAVQTDPGADQTRQARWPKAIEILTKELQLQGQRVADREKELHELRVKLQIPDAVANADAPPQALAPETAHRLEAESIAAQANLAKYETLLAKLKSMPREEVRKSLATAYPGETELVELLTQRNTAQQELARMLTDSTEGNPDVRKVSAVLKEINRQIEDKIDGILTGLSVVVASSRSQVESLKGRLSEERRIDAEAAVKYRPYFEAKHRLAYEQKMYEVFALKITQEKVELGLLRDYRPRSASDRLPVHGLFDPPDPRNP